MLCFVSKAQKIFSEMFLWNSININNFVAMQYQQKFWNKSAKTSKNVV